MYTCRPRPISRTPSVSDRVTGGLASGGGVDAAHRATRRCRSGISGVIASETYIDRVVYQKEG